LKGLKLSRLDINATNIDKGLEHLCMEELKVFTFGNMGRLGAKVDCLKELLKAYIEIGNKLKSGETIED